MNDLITTIQVQADIIWKLRAEKAQMAQKMDDLQKQVAALQPRATDPSAPTPSTPAAPASLAGA